MSIVLLHDVCSIAQAAHSVDRMVSLYMSIQSNFGCFPFWFPEGVTVVLIAPVPGDCLPCT